MISDDEALEITKKLEDTNNIDIKKTIENAATAGYLGEKHFYCTIIEDGGLTHTIPEIFGDPYKSMKLDNFYFDIVSKALDDNGIFISLGYCATNLIIPDDECIEVIEYEDYELNEEEYEYLIEYSLITSKGIKKFKIYAEEGIKGHEKTEDIGLMIKIIDNNYKAYFALRSTDQCMSSFRILPLNINYPKEHPLSLKNPINKILIKMINETIILL
ncbi:hypothetical protein [uncultured Methanobrevibacter sp.]|uniref:hypothetical protein n=1 Tax=uncultured Methanobrevibacter sp. TaxID=253161 RepID=UPI0025F11E72|nr:hypothetical protein [uncultured Methanobrevibacter sp.]